MTVEEVRIGELTPNERESINAKKDEARAFQYECPKIDCSEQMTKIDASNFECLKCNTSYGTFKFREEEEKIKVETAKSPPSKREATPIVEIDSDDSETPKRRRLRARK